ncbi:hypothetical protein CHISP_1205 [Chitinispirillum alkaliphilum]|nr:hypothetical protein CHISP_1205 [Chitinispirillum alkaliphilum]
MLQIQDAGGNFVQRRVHKSAFSKVELFDGTVLDLSLSDWSLSDQADEWDDLFAPQGFGSLTVESSGVEAKVYLDGRLSGITPLTIDPLEEKLYSVELTAYGYEIVEQEVRILSGQKVNLDIAMTRSRAWKDSVKAYEDSVAEIRAQFVSDSLKTAAEQHMAAVVEEASENDNAEKIISSLVNMLSPDPNAPKVLAVLPFTVSEGVDFSAGKSLSEYTVYHLSSVAGLSVVERERFVDMMKEIAVSQTGIVPEDKVLRAGEMLAAQYLVMGSVTEDDGRRLVVVRVVNTETGGLVATSAGFLRARHIDALARELLFEQTSPASTLFRSTLIPGWGQNYGGHRIRGLVYTLTSTGAVAALTWSGFDYLDKQSAVNRLEKDPPRPRIGENPGEYERRLKREFDRAVKERDIAARRTNIAIVGTAAFWIVNMTDAAILGMRNSRSVRNTYFSAIPDSHGNLALGFKTSITF